jgi:hypothetical protein
MELTKRTKYSVVQCKNNYYVVHPFTKPLVFSWGYPETQSGWINVKVLESEAELPFLIAPTNLKASGNEYSC